MKVPSHERKVASDLVIRGREVEPTVVHRHVVKHPVGLGAVHGRLPRSGVRHWDAEGWGKLEPPVITLEERRELVSRIRQLDLDGLRCGAVLLDREENARDRLDEAIPCESCPARLVDRCSRETTRVASLYLSHVDRAFDALMPAVRVERPVLAGRVFQALGRKAPLPRAVLSVGLLPTTGSVAIRINTDDGVTTDFYFDGGSPRWRTTHRSVPRGPNDRAAFLLDLLPGAPGGPLSAQALVPRLWSNEP